VRHWRSRVENAHALVVLNGATAIDGVTDTVHDTAEDVGADGHSDGNAEIDDFLVTHETFVRTNGKATSLTIIDVVSNLHDKALKTGRGEDHLDGGGGTRNGLGTLENNVDDGTDNTGNIATAVASELLVVEDLLLLHLLMLVAEERCLVDIELTSSLHSSNEVVEVVLAQIVQEFIIEERKRINFVLDTKSLIVEHTVFGIALLRKQRGNIRVDDLDSRGVVPLDCLEVLGEASQA